MFRCIDEYISLELFYFVNLKKADSSLQCVKVGRLYGKRSLDILSFKRLVFLIVLYVSSYR